MVNYIQLQKFPKGERTMKKHLIVITAVILLVLMAVPFAMVTSADVTLPAEPTVTNEKVVYIGHGGKGAADGSSDANYLKTDGWDPVNYPTSTPYMNDAIKNGGTIVVVGKGYVGAQCTIAASSSPVLFTAKYGSKDYTGTIDNSKDANGNGLPDGQGTQTGMFMIANQKTVTFMGDVIFEDITIIDRTNGAKAAAGTPKTTTYSVGSTGKMVIGKNVIITGSHNDKENSLYNPILNVEEGGYAFLHSIGFSKYTGKGIIVVGDEVKSSVTAATFADFEGTVVDKNGKLLFSESDDTTEAPETTEDTTPPSSEIPAKPEATGTKKVYVVYDKTEAGVAGSATGGDTVSNPYKTVVASGWSNLMSGKLKDGGTLIAAGKVFVPQTFAFPATEHPLVITAVDGGVDYTSRDGNGDIYYMNATGNNAGQYGMFTIANGNAAGNGKDVVVTFNGDVIFDNIVILSRLTENQKKNGEYTATIVVKKTLTTTNTVQFANMKGEQNYKLKVEAGAVAYLDSVGFLNYTGTGTIVIGDTIKNSVTEAMFAGFEGAIVDSDGNPMFAGGSEGDDTTEAPDDTTTDTTPEDTAPIELPEKPTYTGADKQYVVNDKTEAGVAGSADGGDTASNPYATNIGGAWTKLMTTKLKNGGKIIAAGKVFIPQTFAFPDTGNAIVFTATDGTTDFTSRDAEGKIYYMKADGNNAGQYGMFMIQNGNAAGNGKDVVVTFNGDVIFDNIVILSRLTEGQKNKGEYPATIRITKRLHVTDTVQFANMRGNKNYTLQVDEGAVAFLDSLGFGKYTGKGIIVIGDGVLNRVTADMFENFDGKVVDSQGRSIFGEGVKLPVYVPEEPTATNPNKLFVAHDNNPERDIYGGANGGKSAGYPYATKNGWGKYVTPWLQENGGGTLVAVGKFYIPASYAFPYTAEPIVITSVDSGVNYTSRDDNGNIYYMKADGNNDGQYGMFMIVNSNTNNSGKVATVTFNGDVIFDNIVILSRLTEGQRKKGEYTATININKSIVIKENVRFANMRGKMNYTLNINEDAFAYLHQVGFRRYTGTGTIVVGDNLIGKVTAYTFAGFKGRVVDSNGIDLFEEIPTGDSFSPAFISIIAVSALTVGAVLTLSLKKKKEEI